MAMLNNQRVYIYIIYIIYIPYSSKHLLRLYLELFLGSVYTSEGIWSTRDIQMIHL